MVHLCRYSSNKILVYSTGQNVFIFLVCSEKKAKLKTYDEVFHRKDKEISRLKTKVQFKNEIENQVSFYLLTSP